MKSKQLIPINILLADDDTDDRFFFEKALMQLSFESRLTTVQDGEQVMDYLLKNIDNLPDVLFLDLSMPRKNGFECLSEIKENIQMKDMPVVMFSISYPRDNNYEQNMISMLYKIGAQDFIRKPNDIEQLKKIIHNTLLKVIKKESFAGLKKI